jgi:hypothetical protein
LSSATYELTLVWMVEFTKLSGATKFLAKGNQDESQNKPQENTKKTSLQQNNYMVSCTDPCKVGKD